MVYYEDKKTTIPTINMRITEPQIGPPLLICLTSYVFFFFFFLLSVFFLGHQLIFAFICIFLTLIHFDIFFLCCKNVVFFSPLFTGSNLSHCNGIACSSIAIGKFHRNVSIIGLKTQKDQDPFFFSRIVVTFLFHSDILLFEYFGLEKSSLLL